MTVLLILFWLAIGTLSWQPAAQDGVLGCMRLRKFMKLLTDTEIPVLHCDGRVIMIWRFAAGSVLDRSRWYATMPPLRPLDLSVEDGPRASSSDTFEAVISLAEGLPGYVCCGLDIAPERVARILRNTRILARMAWCLVGPHMPNPLYYWHLDFEGNVREGGYRHGMDTVGPWPTWNYPLVCVDPGESRLDLSVEALAAVSAWDLLRSHR